MASILWNSLKLRWSTAYLFKYGLLNEAVSRLDYIAPNGRMILKRWIEKDVEGSGCGLFQGNIPAFAWREWGKPQTICQNNQCPGQDSNWAPPKYKSEALLVEPPYSVVFKKKMYYYFKKTTTNICGELCTLLKTVKTHFFYYQLVHSIQKS
jgi:hypothetical protein